MTKPDDSPAYHRRCRTAWIVTAVIALAVAILAHAYLRTFTEQLAVGWFVGPHTWTWCLVFAAWHSGWLRRDKTKEMTNATNA